ncbi:putative RiPP precursor [Mesorhizobium sp. LjNodule214]
MKKTYEKPTLVKREKLTQLTAQIVASGVVLGQ